VGYDALTGHSAKYTRWSDVIYHAKKSHLVQSCCQIKRETSVNVRII